MSNARNLANIVTGNFDVPLGALDNVPPSNDASALTTGTLPVDRLPSSGVSANSLTTGTLPAERIANNTITAGHLHTTAITDKLGYTPPSNTDASFNGIIYHSGFGIGCNSQGGHGNTNPTYKICSVQSYYWGAGGVIVEVWRTYYSGFGYAKYRIDGHGATPYGPGYSIVNITSSGSHSSLTLSGLITTAEDSTSQYVNVLVAPGTYGETKCRVTAGLTMRPPGYTTGSNRVIMYNSNTFN